SLNWRIQIAADSLIDEYEPSAVLKNYYPGGLVGHDREGCPVWILPLGDLDIKGLFYSVKKTEIVRYTVRMLELSEEDMKRKSEQKKYKLPIPNSTYHKYIVHLDEV
ncbi:SEC14-like protein 3, partial [Leptotrombidium deliense]